MNKRLLVWLAMIALLLLVGVSMALAQSGESVDDQGNVNDPNDNERANACYDGGTWEGKCDTLYMWMGGWYRIKLDYGLMTADELPSAFQWVASPVWAPAGVCVDILSVFLFIDSSNYVASSAPVYSDAACTTVVGIAGSAGYAYAPTSAEATAICQANGYSSANAMPNPLVWYCS